MRRIYSQADEDTEVALNLAKCIDSPSQGEQPETEELFRMIEGAAKRGSMSPPATKAELKNSENPPSFSKIKPEGMLQMIYCRLAAVTVGLQRRSKVSLIVCLCVCS